MDLVRKIEPHLQNPSFVCIQNALFDFVDKRLLGLIVIILLFLFTLFNSFLKYKKEM